jgi:hypothetical protein
MLLGKVRAATVAEALDGDKDGVEEAGLLDAMIEAACTKVDALLKPTAAAAAAAATTVPAVCADAALAFLCYDVYRLLPTAADKNPFTADVERAEEALQDVADGNATLAPAPTAGTTVESTRIADDALDFDPQEGL